MFVWFLRHTIGVDASSGHMPVAERLLRLAQRPCSLNHHSREGVACPVQVELSDPNLLGIALQVLEPVEVINQLLNGNQMPEIRSFQPMLSNSGLSS